MKLVLNILNIAILFLALGFCIYFGFLDKPTQMGLMIVAGAIFLAFLNLDKFQSFKGAGFEAQMKETVNKAYATQQELEDLVKKYEGKLTELETNIKKIYTTKDEFNELIEEYKEQLEKLNSSIQTAETLALAAL